MTTDAPEPGTPLPWEWTDADHVLRSVSDGDWVLYLDELPEWRGTDADHAYLVYAANELPKAVADRERLLAMLRGWKKARENLVEHLIDHGALEQWDDAGINDAWVNEANMYEDVRALLAEMEATE